MLRYVLLKENLVFENNHRFIRSRKKKKSGQGGRSGVHVISSGVSILRPYSAIAAPCRWHWRQSAELTKASQYLVHAFLSIAHVHSSMCVYHVCSHVPVVLSLYQTCTRGGVWGFASQALELHGSL